MAETAKKEKKIVEEIRTKTPIAEREERILAFWKEQKIFQKTLDKVAPKGEFIFYDGPPFATGEPHYGHILAGTIKDAVPRYKTMQGFRVPRRWGWDCHGLPIENLIEKELGLSGRKAIEDYGIEKFNAAARENVLRYDAVWKEIVPRAGRFVDMDHAYLTMDWPYTESIWWSFKKLAETKDAAGDSLVYQGFKPMHICPRDETTLSNFEVGLNYKELTDISTYVKFELGSGTVFQPQAEPLKRVPDPNFLLAWTTTPWTLPGNVALAVNPKVVYVQALVETEKGKEKVILAKERLGVIKSTYIIEREFLGGELIGKKYKPVFPYYKDAEDLKYKENLYTIVGADFVTTTDGTGIVHIAPAFGEDDYNLSLTAHLPFIQHVGIDGRFKKEVTDFAGELVKPKPTPEEPNLHQKTDVEIIKYLAKHDALFAKEKITHSYPHCWRCDMPLLNYAASSWFVRTTALKDKLISENQKVKWVPEEMGEGRFGSWLENVKDWSVSRSRFWGAPLPVWKCDGCDATEFIGSVAELAEKTRRNRYFLMRHGQAESNVANIISPDAKTKDPLTGEGRKQVKDAMAKFAEELAGKKVDIIFTSPFERTQETAEIAIKELGYTGEVVVDERLRELGAFFFAGKSREERDAAYMAHNIPEGDETVSDTFARMSGFLQEIDAKYKDKTILVISHASPLAAALHVVEGNRLVRGGGGCDMSFMDNAEVREFPFAQLPRDKNFKLDLHRPYIDAIQFPCAKCGGTMKRIGDVFDTWYESGSMPFASVHFPFEQKGAAQPPRFPADFIAEGQDQTRGWFYSLLALSTGLFGETPYKNVVVNGIVLAEDGQKMSKKLKNYPDITVVFDKYGADALRYYLLSSPAVEAEDVLFSEKGLDEVVKKNINRLENVYAFYALYADGSVGAHRKSTHVLDRWILARLDVLAEGVTEAMERYELDKATRPFADFIDDLSTWYLRRSRDRFKNETDLADKNAALATTCFVFLEVSKLLAPFMPFLAEDIYQKTKTTDGLESVHLETWPEYKKADHNLLTAMAKTRELVSLALEARASAGIKIRQPLAELFINEKYSMVSGDFAELVKDEINIKKISIDSSLADSVRLDTVLTPDLKNQGIARDFIRSVQELRKDAGLSPNQDITLAVKTSTEGTKIIESHADDIKRVTRSKKIIFGQESSAAPSTFSVEGISFEIYLKF